MRIKFEPIRYPVRLWGHDVIATMARPSHLDATLLSAAAAELIPASGEVSPADLRRILTWQAQTVAEYIREFATPEGEPVELECGDVEGPLPSDPEQRVAWLRQLPTSALQDLATACCTPTEPTIRRPS